MVQKFWDGRRERVVPRKVLSPITHNRLRKAPTPLGFQTYPSNLKRIRTPIYMNLSQQARDGAPCTALVQYLTSVAHL